MVQEQYKNLILPQRQQLYFVALKLLADEQDAEDAVQEALLKLWASRALLDIPVILTTRFGDIDHPLGCVSLNTMA